MVRQRTFSEKGWAQRDHRELTSAASRVGDTRSFMVLLCRVVATTVHSLREMKHTQGMTIAKIHESYGDISEDLIARVVFYRQWVLIETTQSLIGICTDILQSDIVDIQQIAKAGGIIISTKNLQHLQNSIDTLIAELFRKNEMDKDMEVGSGE